MSHIHFAAWGTVDIETLERMKRRVYIRKVREILAPHNIDLICGGSKTAPFYAIKFFGNIYAEKGEGAFAKVLKRALDIIEGRDPIASWTDVDIETLPLDQRGTFISNVVVMLRGYGVDLVTGGHPGHAKGLAYTVKYKDQRHMEHGDGAFSRARAHALSIIKYNDLTFKGNDDDAG